MHLRRVAILLLCLLPPATAANEQRPQPAVIDAAGLLRIDPMYYGLAAATGGDFYFWAPGEFRAFDLPLADEPVLLAYGSFPGREREFVIPVEHGALRLSVFVGMQRQDRVSLLRPDGSIVADGAGVQRQAFRHMSLFELNEPMPGVWRLRVSGVGHYSLSAKLSPSRADATPQLVDFNFVEIGGRPYHEGWFPIERAPRKGESIDCRAYLAGTVSALQFVFVDGEGRDLAPQFLQREDGHDFHGRCRVPAQPFRIAVRGRDGQGYDFQRMVSPLLTPQ